MIPINDDLASVLANHWAGFVKAFGQPELDHYLFAYGSPVPSDPARHVMEIKHGWKKLMERAGVSCRLHDLRHTFATWLAENSVSRSTMLALMGHMSRSILERYSHIRMAAKRDAVAGVTLRTKHGKVTERSGDMGDTFCPSRGREWGCHGRKVLRRPSWAAARTAAPPPVPTGRFPQSSDKVILELAEGIEPPTL
jgi:hypothetical protein